MTEFSVDPERLDDLADSLEQRRRRIQDARERLASSARALAAGWEGTSHGGFVDTHSWWSGQLERQLDALAESAGLAHEAATTYRETDAAVADLFR